MTCSDFSVGSMASCEWDACKVYWNPCWGRCEESSARSGEVNIEVEEEVKMNVHKL